MTDFPVPGGLYPSTRTSSIRVFEPPRPPHRNRLATAALGCVVIFFLAVGMAIVLHPNIPGALLVAIAILPVGGIVLGVASRPRVKRVGRRRAHTAITVGGVLVVLLLGISILLPSLCRPREGALVAKCHSNLCNIWVGLDAYANSHNGQYPPTLDTLVAEGGMTPSILVCPASLDSPAKGNTPEEVLHNLRSESFHQSYIYIPPTAARLAGDGVIVYEHPQNHRHAHLHVLFRSGEIRLLTKKEADVLIPDLAKVQDTSQGD